MPLGARRIQKGRGVYEASGHSPRQVVGLDVPPGSQPWPWIVRFNTCVAHFWNMSPITACKTLASRPGPRACDCWPYRNLGRTSIGFGAFPIIPPVAGPIEKLCNQLIWFVWLMSGPDELAARKRSPCVLYVSR